MKLLGLILFLACALGTYSDEESDGHHHKRHVGVVNQAANLAGEVIKKPFELLFGKKEPQVIHRPPVAVRLYYVVTIRDFRLGKFPEFINKLLEITVQSRLLTDEIAVSILVTYSNS